MSKCASRKTGRPSELNNTANAGRIVRGRNGRKILPAFLLTILSRHLPSPRYRRKRKRAEINSAQIRKRSVVKAVGTIRQENRQGRGKLPPCMPQSECGAGHTGYRAFLDPSPDGSQDTGGAFRSRVQRSGVRGCSHEQRSKTSIPQRTDLAQVKRDRNTDRSRKARNTKAFRLRQSNSFAEIRRKRLSLPTGEVRPSEHNYDYKEISLYDHKRYLPHSRYPVGQAGAA